MFPRRFARWYWDKSRSAHIECLTLMLLARPRTPRLRQGLAVVPPGPLAKGATSPHNAQRRLIGATCCLHWQNSGGMAPGATLPQSICRDPPATQAPPFVRGARLDGAWDTGAARLKQREFGSAFGGLPERPSSSAMRARSALFCLRTVLFCWWSSLVPAGSVLFRSKRSSISVSRQKADVADGSGTKKKCRQRPPRRRARALPEPRGDARRLCRQCNCCGKVPQNWQVLAHAYDHVEISPKNVRCGGCPCWGNIVTTAAPRSAPLRAGASSLPSCTAARWYATRAYSKSPKVPSPTCSRVLRRRSSSEVSHPLDVRLPARALYTRSRTMVGMIGLFSAPEASELGEASSTIASQVSCPAFPPAPIPCRTMDTSL